MCLDFYKTDHRSFLFVVQPPGKCPYFLLSHADLSMYIFMFLQGKDGADGKRGRPGERGRPVSHL